MTRRLVSIVLLVTAGLVQAQSTPTPGNAKVYEVGKDGLNIDGKLSKDDPPLVNAPVAELKGAPHQVFHVKLHKGQHYVINLVSKDFDAFLILLDAAGKRLAYDDDSGGELDSRIAFSASSDGVYRLLTAALDKRPGAFQVTIRAGELSEEEKLAAEATRLEKEAIQLYRRNQPAQALIRMRQSLEIRQKIYPVSRFPDGHHDLAQGLNNLGVVLRAMGQAEQALPYFQQCLVMNCKLFPVSKYPDGNADLADSLNNLGVVFLDMGQAEMALPHYAQSLAMRRKLFPESKSMELAESLNNLGVALQSLGQFEKALPYFEQSLSIWHKLFPESTLSHGHPQFALNLANLANVLQAMGQEEKALPHYEQSLAMRRKLFPESNYPDGHPDLASSLNHMGSVLLAMAQAEKALPHFKQSLAMRRKLFPESKYPDGHPDLTISLNNLGFVLTMMGQAEAALPYHEQTVAMMRKLFPDFKYPEGHPYLATSLSNLGGVLWTMGQAEKALPFHEQALAMQRRLGRRFILTASEVEALAFAQARPLTRDAFLSLTFHLRDTSARAYESVWASKSAITRVLAQRHAAARVAGTGQAAQLDELKGLRRRIDQLQQDRRLRPTDRDEILAKATDKRDKLERALARTLPMRQRAAELDALGPEALVRLLPDHAVLIDIVRYTRFAYDRAKPGIAGETRTLSYTAFVVGPAGRAGPGGAAGAAGAATLAAPSIQRIELGAANAIDGAVDHWRNAIENRPASSAAAKQLHDLVWAKLAPHVPAGTKTLYLAPDGDLARAPWAALPIGKDRVLLEEYLVAQVPHGPFLLEHLKYPRSFPGGGSLLALGDVNYGEGVWPTLPGTKVEIAALGPLAPAALMTLSQDNATPKALAWGLEKVRFAHLATHGQFQAKEFAAEQERADKAMQARRFGHESQSVATKNPLGYVGLVLSGGEVISGLSILDLNLEYMQLVTLSACETGLGEYTGGKGVENLQLAFHVAGCPNVVASLWKVNDDATAALMTKFYHEMWVNKKPPIEALREAQLTIYRHPERIPILASRDRGIRVNQVVALPAGVDLDGKKAAPTGKADTKLWAAFVLSGVGR